MGLFSRNDSPLSQRNIKRIFSNIPTLETQRLILRKITLSDAEDMYDYSKLPEVTKYLTWTPHASIRQTENYIKLLERKYASGDFYDWGLEDKESGRMIGTCGFTSFVPDENSAEIGYVLSPDFRGRGLVAEGALAVMKFGFATFELDRIFARYMQGNDASAKVMKKCGMKFEAMHPNSEYIKGEYKTICVCSISRDEYERSASGV